MPQERQFLIATRGQFGRDCGMVKIIVRSVVLFFIFFLIVGPIVILFAAMENSPVVKVRTPINDTDAVRARAIYREFRALTEGGLEQRRIRISQSDISSVLAFAVRSLPFLRGAAMVTSDAVQTTLSANSSNIPAGGWLNLRVVVKPSDTGLYLASIQLGPFDLPSDLVLPALGHVLDAVLDDDLGQVAVKSIDGVAINSEKSISALH